MALPSSTVSSANFAFTFVVIHRDKPDMLVGVRCQTPLVVGLGEGENFLASNLGAFLSETRRVQFPGNGQVVEITPLTTRVIDAVGLGYGW